MALRLRFNRAHAWSREPQGMPGTGWSQARRVIGEELVYQPEMFLAVATR
jgi:hypothetical protein